MLDIIEHKGPIAVILCGMPGSGKSTAAAAHFDRLPYLSTDHIIEQAARATGATYDDMFEEFIGEATASVNDSFRAIIANRSSFVWDQTNLSAKKRRKITSQLPKGYYKMCVLVQTSDATRKSRLTARVGKTVPEHILRSMAYSFVMPSLEEGFDRVEVINT